MRERGEEEITGVLLCVLVAAGAVHLGQLPGTLSSAVPAHWCEKCRGCVFRSKREATCIHGRGWCTLNKQCGSKPNLHRRPKIKRGRLRCPAQHHKPQSRHRLPSTVQPAQPCAASRLGIGSQQPRGLAALAASSPTA